MRKGHPLQNVRLSRRLDQNAYHTASARSPLAAAVDIRRQFMEYKWSCIVEGPDRLLIAASWSRPYRTYTLAEATRLLANLEVSV